MLKVLYLVTFVGLVVGQQEVKGATEIKSNTSNKSSLSTSTEQQQILGDKKETVLVNVPLNKEDDPGTAENPFDPPQLVKLADEESLGSFKYYFVILAASSLSVIAVIIFKTLRLRKSRAEIKYGKASADRSEFEPLGKSNNKWLDISDDEDQEEIFDINFLKNSRSNQKV